MILYRKLSDNSLALDTVQVTAREGIETYTDSVTMTSRSVNSLKGSLNQVKSLREKTAKMIRLIKELAGVSQQTEMLALNADIEAGRAVDEGKGFTVIAQEVRQLTEKTAFLVENIQAVATEVQNQRVKVVQEIQKSNDYVQKTQDMISEAREGFTAIFSQIEGAKKKNGDSKHKIGTAVPIIP